MITVGPVGWVGGSSLALGATGRGILSRSGIQITGNLKDLGGIEMTGFASRWHSAMKADFALVTGAVVVRAHELSRRAEEQFVESAR
jgi:hypothetical protein